MNDGTLIKGRINNKNIKSKEVFSKIGFVNIIDNNYEINGKKLLEWEEKVNN